MKNFISKHSTEAAYNGAQSSFDLPHVSLIDENSLIIYSPHVATPNHEYIEIGGIKWATMNLGAESITDTGLYFQWGDTQGYTVAQVGNGSDQKYFDWTDYKFSKNGTTTMTKYNSTDSKTVLDPEDDTVVAAWGGNWRMPTRDEFRNLINAVNREWVTNYQDSGVNGMLMTDKTDSSKILFFPACGNAAGGSVHDVGISGCYWSSLLLSYPVNGAYQLYFISSGMDWNYTSNRRDGFSVRGVLDD